MRRGIGGHQSHNSKSNEYVTPLEVLQPLGTFDLDPCSPIIRPWDTALKHYTIVDDGLKQPWEGRVWLNPPYSDKEIEPWLRMMHRHRNGILLIFNRSCRIDHHELIYPVAESMFLRKGRLTFCDIYGEKYPYNGGAPNVFFSYTERDADALADSRFPGTHIPLNKAFVIVVTASSTWRAVITKAIDIRKGEAQLQDIYTLVERLAPDKTEANKNWKEKVRQKLQQHFTRITKGVYSNNN